MDNIEKQLTVIDIRRLASLIDSFVFTILIIKETKPEIYLVFSIINNNHRITPRVQIYNIDTKIVMRE